MEKNPYVYILASKPNGTLYIGVTSDLVKRVWQHKNNQVEGFTKKYNVHHLVWYEKHEDMQSAIVREKQFMWTGVLDFINKNGLLNWKFDLLKKQTQTGVICISKYSKTWIPACAGMTNYHYSSIWSIDQRP